MNRPPGPRHVGRACYGSGMEVVGVIENGRVVLPATVHLEEGTRVRVIVEDAAPASQPLERSPVTEEMVRADIAWALSHRFPR